MKANHAGYRLALHVAQQSANATVAMASLARTASKSSPSLPVAPVVIPLLRVLLHDLFALHEIQRQAKKGTLQEVADLPVDAGAQPRSASKMGGTASLDIGALKSWYVEVKQTFQTNATRSRLGFGSNSGFLAKHNRVEGAKGLGTDSGSDRRGGGILETLLQARVATVQVKQPSQLWTQAEAIEGSGKRREPFVNSRRAVEGLSNIGLV